MILWGLNPMTWRELDDHDRAVCLAHYRLKQAYDAQASHVQRDVAEIMAKRKKDDQKGGKQKLVSPVSRWSALPRP